MGGMDEDLFLGNDDLDLSWRLRNAGRKLVVASDAFVFHEGQKSFQTEKKSHVDRLTQESTDALYRKLVKHYGGRDRVPSAMELWGIGWFSPSPSLVAGLDDGAVGLPGPSRARGRPMIRQRMERDESLQGGSPRALGKRSALSCTWAPREPAPGPEATAGAPGAHPGLFAGPARPGHPRPQLRRP